MSKPETTTKRTPAPAAANPPPWGMLAAIDLHGCDLTALQDPHQVRRFFTELVSEIGMHAHGDLQIQRFGSPADRLDGLTAVQLIETSSVTFHGDEHGHHGCEVGGEHCRRAFIDVFSCRPFDPAVAATVAAAFFIPHPGPGTGDYLLRVAARGDLP